MPKKWKISAFYKHQSKNFGIVFSSAQSELSRIRHNSDRGSQYVSKEYKQATAKMNRSYSKKAFPWDNACIESFHSLIKREWLNRFKISNYKHAYRLVFEYLETFYNTKRIHSHCDYMSPDDFERLYQQATSELLAGQNEKNSF